MNSSLRPSLQPLDDALAALLADAKPLQGTETVNTFGADHRVLAHDLVSPLHVPPIENAAMDGYAVRCTDITAPGCVMAVSQRIPAGSAGAALQLGTAARIFTGAPVPEGADAIVMQEDAEALDDGRVRIRPVPLAGQWIRHAGEDIQRGAVVMHRGTRLTPAHLGLAASMGQAELTVARRPRVALFSTGDELVMPGAIAPEHLPPGAIYNSNRYFLSALLVRMGCEVTDYGTVPDRAGAVLLALKSAARDHDVILTSGGVSVGAEDHIKPAVESLGRLNLWRIDIKPGKPFAYGQILGRDGAATHFMGLPGNPVSSFITFALLVRPFLLRLQGIQDVAPKIMSATAQFDWPKPDKRREFLRVRRGVEGLELFANQGSSVLTSTVWGDGVVDNPPGAAIERGDTVRYISFAELLA